MKQDVMAPIIAFGLIILLTVCTIFLTSSEKELKIKSVSAEIIRDEFVEYRLNELKHSQFAGDAEIGVSGGVKLYKMILDEAEKRFPLDKEYFYIGFLKDTPSEYKCIVKISTRKYLIKKD